MGKTALANSAQVPPMHIKYDFYKGINTNMYSLCASIICHSKVLDGLYIIAKRVQLVGVKVELMLLG